MNSLDESKILFVVNSFSGGGAENSVMGVTRNLREKGIPVLLCALNRNSPQDLPDPRPPYSTLYLFGSNKNPIFSGNSTSISIRLL